VSAPEAPAAPEPPTWGQESGAAVLTTVGVVLLGAPLGLLWAAVAPPVDVVVGEGGSTRLADPLRDAFIAVDGTFLVLALLAGLLSGVLGWRLGRRFGPGVVVGLVVGGLLAAEVARVTASWSTPASPRPASRPASRDCSRSPCGCAPSRRAPRGRWRRWPRTWC
jgi:hypothetical protein